MKYVRFGIESRVLYGHAYITVCTYMYSMSVPPGRSPGSTGETNLRAYTLSLLPSPPLGVQGILLSLMGGVCVRASF